MQRRSPASWVGRRSTGNCARFSNPPGRGTARIRGGMSRNGRRLEVTERFCRVFASLVFCPWFSFSCSRVLVLSWRVFFVSRVPSSFSSSWDDHFSLASRRNEARLILQRSRPSQGIFQHCQGFVRGVHAAPPALATFS